MSDKKAICAAIHRKWTYGVFDRENPYWGLDAIHEAFAAGAEVEREECAKLVESLAYFEDLGDYCFSQSPADVIRARGTP